MTEVAIVYHSEGGRTRALAEAVARGAAAVEGTRAQLFAVPAVDHAALLAADAIVFGCPTYMGSASAAFKAFLDGTSAIWALQAWRDKLAAAFTHSAAPSGDKLGTLMQLAVFAAQHGMIWVGLGLPPTYAGLGSAAAGAAGDTNRLGSHLGAMAQSPPGAGGVPASDLGTAEHLGRRVAEAARRWGRIAVRAETARHPATATWKFPPVERPPLPAPLQRVNLREMMARPERLEHHLVVCGTLGRVQLEIVTASEPLYFGHVNMSDEFALALPSGDAMIDRFPVRTFVSEAATGADVGRYNHRVGDLLLHPVGYLHWPGRLRPPYAPFELPPGIRRCGLSLVMCANAPAASNAPLVAPPAGREGDVKPYVAPAPPLSLAAVGSGEGGGADGVIARIGAAELALALRPEVPPRGGWIVVLEADEGSAHAACDLIYAPAGAALDVSGIRRALVLASAEEAPDLPPPSWQRLPPLPFAPFEDAEPGALPVRIDGLTVEEAPEGTVAVSIEGGDASARVPRYWLARMLFRAALHDLRLGYIETYGGLFLDDRGGASPQIELGLRAPTGAKTAIAIPRADAAAAIERLYRAVAPAGYRERLR